MNFPPHVEGCGCAAWLSSRAARFVFELCFCGWPAGRSEERFGSCAGFLLAAPRTDNRALMSGREAF
jgi:hypothetical protein